jgi:hypothetical protein
MNRADLQQLAELRLQESKALLAAQLAEGAYYLAGYAVECALKSCIAKRTREHDFPEKGSHKFYSHDLKELLGFADLKLALDQEVSVNSILKANWAIVQNWSEESRYEKGRTLQEAQGLLVAIEDQIGGMLPWLQRRW